MPMIERSDRQEWYHDGKLHREDGPAVEWLTGETEWWLHGRLHRDDGPAIEWRDGTKVYYQHGVMTKTVFPEGANHGIVSMKHGAVRTTEHPRNTYGG